MMHRSHSVSGGINGHLNWVSHELTNQVTNIAVQSGGEQHCLIASGATAQYPLNLRCESIVSHAIGFIKYNYFHGGEINFI